MDRPNLRRHLTFGFGPHTCVGAQLARGELRVVLNKLFDRMKNFRFSRGDASVERETHFFVYAPRALYVAFDRL
jgi:cytochrome P450